MSFQTAETPQQQEYDGVPFPLVLEWRGEGRELSSGIARVAAERNELSDQLERHGAILFRGLPLVSAEDFDAFIAAFGVPNFTYQESLSNAVRFNRTERVFTANEAPPDVTIYLHHEMAQTPVYPCSLFFFCEQAADRGGATPLCRSDVLLDSMQKEIPGFVTDCRERGLRYTNVMPAVDDAASGMGRSWQSTLSVEAKTEAENRLRTLGYEWEWLADDCLRVTTPVLPAIRELASGKEAFFNQLIAAFSGWKDSRNDPNKAITFGDRTPLDRGAVMRAAELAEALTFDLNWQTGDVAWVDNFSTMHGRRTFEGTRKVLASLVAHTESN